ncbi:MAG: rRNA maturation RNase YbeY [Bdellovibrionales bacterium]|nr:rRNA maturation RNase YbeY [Bdellovibrionales bacterium]
MECDIPGEHIAELSIVLTNDQEIQELNRDYRGKDKATDVLSFSMFEGEGGEFAESLGDVVISEEYAARQAEDLGFSFPEEMLRLLIHGILHLCGFEHENVDEATAEEMFEKQDALWDKYRTEVGEIV